MTDLDRDIRVRGGRPEDRGVAVAVDQQGGDVLFGPEHPGLREIRPEHPAEEPLQARLQLGLDGLGDAREEPCRAAHLGAGAPNGDEGFEGEVRRPGVVRPNRYGVRPVVRTGVVRMARREVYLELPSTQDRAVELARSGVEAGSVVVARHQSRGRGRGDRQWESPAGGLYLSLVLRPSSLSPLLPLAIGAGVADAISMEYRVRLRLKWPNDLLAVDGAGTPRKLAGVLVDVVPASDGGAAAVVGIGVNAQGTSADLSAGVRGRATALELLTAAPVDLDRLETVVVGAAADAARTLGAPGGDRLVLARVRGLLYGVGEPVTVDGRSVGTLRTVADDGTLVVAGPEGVVQVAAGHLRVGVGE